MGIESFNTGDVVLVIDSIMAGMSFDGVTINSTMAKFKGTHVKIKGIRKSDKYWGLYEFKIEGCMFWFPRKVFVRRKEVVSVGDNVVIRNGIKGTILQDNSVKLEDGTIIKNDYIGYNHRNIRAFDIVGFDKK